MRRMPSVRLFKLNLDQLAGNVALSATILYVGLYGYVQVGGFVLDVNWGYLSILLPILLFDGAKSTIEMFMRSSFAEGDEDISKVTAVIACKNGETIIGKTIKSALHTFPPHQIIVAANGCSDRTVEVARSFGVICEELGPIGKVRAINEVLHLVKTPYVLLLDDDTLLKDAKIPTSILDNGYNAVAFRVFVKKTTWVSYFQMHEYRKSMDISKSFHSRHGSVQNVSGAIGLFTLAELLRQIKLHTGEFSGEDLQRTLLAHMANGSKGVVLSDSIVVTEGPATLKDLYKQRVFGWFPGLYANMGLFIKLMFRKKVPRPLRVDAFYSCFVVTALDIIRVLALPVMIFYPGYFAVTYVVYVSLELVPYFKNGRREPLWVILLYPLYGIFNLLTRICALVVFIYRRLVARAARLAFFDDYREAPGPVKTISSTVVVALFSSLLALNLTYNYSAIFTNVDLTRVVGNLLSF